VIQIVVVYHRYAACGTQFDGPIPAPAIDYQNLVGPSDYAIQTGTDIPLLVTREYQNG
jgi:hypothetical protein